MDENKYPTPYEVKEVCNSFLKRSFIDSFSKSLGLFFINATQEDVSSNLSKILFDKNDIDTLRANAYQNNSKHTLSGFTLSSSDPNFNLQELYERARDTDRHILDKGYRLYSLTRIQTDSNEPTYKGAIEYKKKKPGRIEFLDEEKGYSDFYFKNRGEDGWQVEVDGNRSSDGKEVLKLITSFINSRSTNVIEIHIDSLKQKSTIDFFDELARVGLNKDNDKAWRFTDVKQLTFKRAKNDSSDEEEIDEDDDSVEREQLTGISQAILEGRNLREDPFVLKYENEGCIFTAMTYEFEHIKKPEIIQLRAEFKGSPKIFEVSIISFKVIQGIDKRKVIMPLSTDRHMELRSLFWNNARKVYQSLLS